MSDDQDIVEWLQAACHDSEGEPLEQDGFSNATVEEVELAIMEIARLRADLAAAQVAAFKKSAEIARLRAAIERLAQWHDAHAAHYEDQERQFNGLPDGMSVAANFAQAKFQHKQRAAAIRAALGGKND